MKEVITREDGSKYVNVSINIDPTIIVLIDEEAERRGTDRSALIQSNLKAWHIDGIVKKLQQQSICEHHVNIDLHKEIKTLQHKLTVTKRDQGIVSKKKGFNYQRAANICIIISMALGLAVSQGWIT